MKPNLRYEGWEKNYFCVHSHPNVRLFQIAPQAVKMFPKFSDVPLDQLAQDASYRGHATSVMQAVQLAVGSIDDLDGLFATLKDLGTVHTGLGIQDIHFLVSWLLYL